MLPVAWMVNAPVVGSTVPVTLLATADTSRSLRSFAAPCSTAVLPSVWTGSGRVTRGVPLVPLPPVLAVDAIWITTVDWYCWVRSFE